MNQSTPNEDPCFERLFGLKFTPDFVKFIYTILKSLGKQSLYCSSKYVIPSAINHFVGDDLFSILLTISHGRNKRKIIAILFLLPQQMFKRPLFFSATSSKFYCQDPPYNIRRTESHSVPIYSIDKKYVLIRSFFYFQELLIYGTDSCADISPVTII